MNLIKDPLHSDPAVTPLVSASLYQNYVGKARGRIQRREVDRPGTQEQSPVLRA